MRRQFLNRFGIATIDARCMLDNCFQGKDELAAQFLSHVNEIVQLLELSEAYITHLVHTKLHHQY